MVQVINVVRTTEEIEVEEILKTLVEAYKRGYLGYPYNDNICFNQIVRTARKILRILNCEEGLSENELNLTNISKKLMDEGLSKTQVFYYLNILNSLGLVVTFSNHDYIIEYRLRQNYEPQ